MPRTLLLADDSITIQKVVSITFAAEDFTVVTVDNGEDAFARARELRPAIVIADVAMPRRNGYELSQALKSDPELHGIPVLLLAGTFEPLDPAKAAASQANGHLVKPFDTQALIDKVTELLGGPAAVTMPGASPAPIAQAPAAPRAATPAWQQGVPARPQPLSYPLAPPAAQPLSQPMAQPAGGPPQRPVPLTAPQARPPTSPFGIPAGIPAAPAAARPTAPIPLTPPAAAPRAPLPLTSPVASPLTSPFPTAPSAIPMRPAAFATPVPQRVSPFSPPPAPPSGAPVNPAANPASAAPSPFGRPAAPNPAAGPAIPQRIPVAPAPAPNPGRVPMPFPAAAPPAFPQAGSPVPSAWGAAVPSQPAPAAFAPQAPGFPPARVPAPAAPPAALTPAPADPFGEPFGIPGFEAGFDTPGPLEISGMAEAAAAASVNSSPNDLSLDVPMDEDPPELLPEIDGFELGSSQDLDVSMTGGSASAFISGELSDFSQPVGMAPVEGLEFDATSEHEQPLELASPHEFMDLTATQPIKPLMPEPTPRTPAPRIAIPLSVPVAPAKAPIPLTAAATASAPQPDGEAALRQALSQASREVIERVVWEVVPQLAEVILREHVERMARERA